MSNARSKESGMRKLWLGIIGLAAASTANAALVTFTMSYNEGATGLVNNSAWTLYATVSQADNAGLFAFGVDMRAVGEPGGPSTFTIAANRTPNGLWSIDDADPNYDGGTYADKVGGFGTGRGASNTTGVVSGVQDLAADANLQWPVIFELQAKRQYLVSLK